MKRKQSVGVAFFLQLLFFSSEAFASRDLLALLAEKGIRRPIEKLRPTESYLLATSSEEKGRFRGDAVAIARRAMERAEALCQKFYETSLEDFTVKGISEKIRATEVHGGNLLTRPHSIISPDGISRPCHNLFATLECQDRPASLRAQEDLQSKPHYGPGGTFWKVQDLVVLPSPYIRRGAWVSYRNSLGHLQEGEITGVVSQRGQMMMPSYDPPRVIISSPREDGLAEVASIPISNDYGPYPPFQFPQFLKLRIAQGNAVGFRRDGRNYLEFGLVHSVKNGKAILNYISKNNERKSLEKDIEDLIPLVPFQFLKTDGQLARLEVSLALPKGQIVQASVKEIDFLKQTLVCTYRSPKSRSLKKILAPINTAYFPLSSIGDLRIKDADQELEANFKISSDLKKILFHRIQFQGENLEGYLDKMIQQGLIPRQKVRVKLEQEVSDVHLTDIFTTDSNGSLGVLLFIDEGEEDSPEIAQISQEVMDRSYRFRGFLATADRLPGEEKFYARQRSPSGEITRNPLPPVLQDYLSKSIEAGWLRKNIPQDEARAFLNDALEWKNENNSITPGTSSAQ